MTSSRDDRLGPDEGPGDLLRRGREASGLSQQQVAEQLNLDVTVIEAIEANDFPALGAPVFARGHLRRYAVLLGVSEAELLGAYDRVRHPEAPTLVPRAHLDHVPERRPARWPFFAVALVAIVGAIALVTMLRESGFRLPWQARPADVSAPLSATAGGEPAVVEDGSPAAIGAPPATEGAQATPGADAVAGAPETGAVATGLLQLEFQFVQDSWIEIFDGTGKAVLYDLGAAGSRRTVSAQAPLNVTIGNAPAVALTVNGKPVVLPRPEPGQTVVRVRLDRNGRIG